MTVTDPNGITTTLQYDGLGRLTDVWGYNRPTSSAANDIYSYAVSDSAPTVVTTQKLNDAGGYVTSTTLYDALLRVRQTQYPTPQGGILVTDHFYDSRRLGVEDQPRLVGLHRQPRFVDPDHPRQPGPRPDRHRVRRAGPPDRGHVLRRLGGEIDRLHRLLRRPGHHRPAHRRHPHLHGDRRARPDHRTGLLHLIADGEHQHVGRDHHGVDHRRHHPGHRLLLRPPRLAVGHQGRRHRRGLVPRLQPARPGHQHHRPELRHHHQELRRQREPDQRHRRRRAHDHLHLRRAQPQDRRIRRAVHLIPAARLLDLRQLQQRRPE